MNDSRSTIITLNLTKCATYSEPRGTENCKFFPHWPVLEYQPGKLFSCGTRLEFRCSSLSCKIYNMFENQLREYSWRSGDLAMPVRHFNQLSYEGTDGAGWSTGGVSLSLSVKHWFVT